MAIIPIGRNYPNPMKWEDRVRNGKVPDSRLVANAINEQFFALAHCRKLFFHKAVQPGSTPQSVAGTVTPWRWLCRTGEGTETGASNTMLIEANVLPSSSTLGTDPRWRVFVSASGSDSPTYSDYQRFPLEDTSPTFDQITMQWTQITGLAPNADV